MKPLSQRAAELFSEKPWKHEMKGNPATTAGVWCNKCQQWIGDCRTDCTIPDPIDITDLGKALECLRNLREPTLLLMDKCDAKSFYPYMDEVVGDLTSAGFKTWLLYDATAEQIWEICCLAKESDGE